MSSYQPSDLSQSKPRMEGNATMPNGETNIEVGTFELRLAPYWCDPFPKTDGTDHE